jgi:hypothetical protein
MPQTKPIPHGTGAALAAERKRAPRLVPVRLSQGTESGRRGLRYPRRRAPADQQERNGNKCFGCIREPPCSRFVSTNRGCDVERLATTADDGISSIPVIGVAVTSVLDSWNTSGEGLTPFPQPCQPGHWHISVATSIAAGPAEL